jgi:hypothetical protein
LNGRELFLTGRIIENSAFVKYCLWISNHTHMIFEKAQKKNPEEIGA